MIHRGYLLQVPREAITLWRLLRKNTRSYQMLKALWSTSRTMKFLRNKRAKIFAVCAKVILQRQLIAENVRLNISDIATRTTFWRITAVAISRITKVSSLTCASIDFCIVWRASHLIARIDFKAHLCFSTNFSSYALQSLDRTLKLEQFMQMIFKDVLHLRFMWFESNL